MFFLDGCAILQAIYLRYAPDIDEEDASNEFNTKNDLLTFVYLDLFLLENQQPYRVLELLTSSSNQGKIFKESIKRFIDDNVMTPAEMKKEQQRCLQQQKHGKPQQQQQKQEKQQMQQKQREREPAYLLELLRARLEAGIWLGPSETSCLMDISFNRICCVGKLSWLPPITVDDSTGPKFKNLILYEKCPDFDNAFAITSYICFLDSMIDEAEDVKAL
ncbi:hypothetical protein REPUB_Repub06bG0112000 [Reevesia pubescens]